MAARAAEQTTRTPAEPSYASGIADVPLLGETIGQNLDRTAAAHPDAEALVDVDSGRRWTYPEFVADVDRLARGLPARGIGKGDRVGIWAVNCPERLLVQYTTARIGAVMVNINPAYRTHELAYVLRQAGIVMLIASTEYKTSDYRSMAREVAGACPALRETVHIGTGDFGALVEAGAGIPAERLRAAEAELSCDDAVNIQYTSGTTGFPKDLGN